MKKPRCPTLNEIKSYINAGKSVKEISSILGITERTVYRYKKKLESTDNDTDKKNDTDNLRQQKINDARVKVINGQSIKKVAEEIGIPRSTLGEYAVKEKWLDKQKRYNQFIYEKMLEEKAEEHLTRRKEALKFLNYIQAKAMLKLNSDNLTTDDALTLERAVNIVMKSIKGQAELLGISNIENLIKDKISDEDNNKNTSLMNIRKKYGL